MTPMQFCFWLAGILRMSKDDSPTDKLIREQLDEVIKRESLPRTNSVNTNWKFGNGGGIPCSPEGTVPVKLSSQEPLTFRQQPEHGWAYCNNPTGDTISDR